MCVISDMKDLWYPNVGAFAELKSTTYTLFCFPPSEQLREVNWIFFSPRMCVYACVDEAWYSVNQYIHVVVGIFPLIYSSQLAKIRDWCRSAHQSLKLTESMPIDVHLQVGTELIWTLAKQDGLVRKLPLYSVPNERTTCAVHTHLWKNRWDSRDRARGGLVKSRRMRSFAVSGSLIVSFSVPIISRSGCVCVVPFLLVCYLPRDMRFHATPHAYSLIHFGTLLSRPVGFFLRSLANSITQTSTPSFRTFVVHLHLCDEGQVFLDLVTHARVPSERERSTFANRH